MCNLETKLLRPSCNWQTACRWCSSRLVTTFMIMKQLQLQLMATLRTRCRHNILMVASSCRLKRKPHSQKIGIHHSSVVHTQQSASAGQAKTICICPAVRSQQSATEHCRITRNQINDHPNSDGSGRRRPHKTYFDSCRSGIESDILALKHVSRIFGHCNHPALLVSHFQASIWALNRGRGHTHKPDRKAVLGCCNVRKFYWRASKSEDIWV